MKNSTQTVLFAVILIAGFWFGMQLGDNDEKETPRVDLPRPVQSTLPTPTDTNININTSPTTDTTTPVDSNTQTSSPTTPDTITTPAPTPITPTRVNTGLPALSETEKIAHYDNTTFGYGFDLSARVYYSGFGAAADARHTVGIGTKAMPETLDTSDVQILFYGKKILPELQTGETIYIDPAGKYVLVLMDGGYSAKITGFDTNPTIVSRIAQTIKMN